MQFEAGRGPTSFHRSLGDIEQVGDLGLGEMLIPEQVEDGFVLVRQVFDLLMKCRPGLEPTGIVSRCRGA